MKLLLLLLSLVGVALGHAIISKPAEPSEIELQSVYQQPQEQAEPGDDKKLDKRSYGWSSPWIWPSYGHGWPSYSHGWSGGHGGWGGWGGWGGHGISTGWSIGWPSISLGHGWHGGHGSGWHGGHGSGWHGGWHSKW